MHYAVFRDGSHTCIVVAIKRKYTYFIPMEPRQVIVAQMTHEEFRVTYDKPFPEYPVRRAAEIYLAAPDKEVALRAKEHLEAILADPAYVYDNSLYSTPNVIKENIMAKKNAAAIAEEVANSPQATSQADRLSSGKPVAKAPKPDKEKTGRTRAPALDTSQRFKCGEGAAKVRAGFMLDFLAEAQKLEKASRGKGFTGDALLEVAAGLEGAAGRDASWVKTYLSYGAAPARGIFVAA